MTYRDPGGMFNSAEEEARWTADQNRKAYEEERDRVTDLENRLEYYREVINVVKEEWKQTLIQIRDEVDSLPVAKALAAKALFNTRKKNDEIIERRNIKVKKSD